MLTLLGSSALYSFSSGASGDEQAQYTGRAGQSAANVGAVREAASGGRTRFTLLHTNDEHSHLIPFPIVNDHEQEGTAQGGFARLAGAVSQVREEKEDSDQDVLLFSAGDHLSGPPFGWLPLSGVAPEMELMQHIGYDGVVVGNHEFDYGAEFLGEYYISGGYPNAHEQLPVLGTNINPPSRHELDDAELRDTTTIELRDGTSIGLFGLLGEGAIEVTMDTKIDSLEFSDQHETARETAADLRDEGADIVMALTHAGVKEDWELARAVDDIDLIVGGHSHTTLNQPILENDTHIVQAGNHLSHLGQLELAYDTASGTLELLNEDEGVDYLHPLDASVPSDPNVREMVSEYESQLHDYVEEVSGGEYTRFDETLMRSDVTLSRGKPRMEMPLGNFITDAMRLETGDFLDERVDFAFLPDGIIREQLFTGEGEWAKDEVLFYDLVTTSGIGEGRDDRPGYPVVSFWATEDEILRAMESSILLTEVMGALAFIQVSGGRFEFDPSRATWGQVPVVDLPLPAYRAILDAERYVGDGVQDDESYESLDGGDTLYRVATDYYLGSLIPEIGEIVPRLDVTPKDESGNEIDLEEAIVKRDDDTELKVWETIASYAEKQPEDEDGTPRLPERYHEPEGRLVEGSGLPLALNPAAGAVAAGTVGYGIHQWWERHGSGESSD